MLNTDLANRHVKKMHLTLVISSLACGGAERALTLLAEGFINNGHNVSVVTLATKEDDFYKVPDGVRKLELGIIRNSHTVLDAIKNNIYRLWVLRKTIESLQPDVVISFLYPTNILILLALMGSKYPVIVSEQNNPAFDTQKFWHKMRHLVYPYAAKVVSVSKGIDIYFDWLPKTKRAVIYNPLQTIQIQPSEFTLPPGANPTKKWVIAMGRLVYQKGFDILLPAFKNIADKHPDWQLLICGEGELRSELETLRDSLGLGKQVLFPGVISNPIALFQHSKLFVFSSRWEGLGVVLLEAMASALPVISTDCPSGPREIVHDEINGILVPNQDIIALATAMDNLMSNQEKRHRLAANAAEVTEFFSLKKIVKLWEDLVGDLVTEKSR